MLILTLEKDDLKVPVTIDERDIPPHYNWTPLMELVLNKLREEDLKRAPQRLGEGPVVRSRRQAIAIALSEAGKGRRRK